MQIIMYAQVSEEGEEDFLKGFLEIYPKNDPDLDVLLHVEQTMLSVLKDIVSDGLRTIARREATHNIVIPTIE